MIRIPPAIPGGAALLLALLAALASPLSAQDSHAPYAHQGSDRLRSMTQEEVDELLAGEGMGLARPAELNGYPGPRHVLDLADSLALDPEQLRRTRELFREMGDRARELGRRVLDAEVRLDRLFAGGDVASEELGAAAAEVARLRGALRLVHLEAHLAMREVLNEHQAHAYQRLRGYGEGHSGH